MIVRLYRPLVMSLAPVALIACMNSAPTIAKEGTTVPLGVDLGGSGPVTASPEPRAPSAGALGGEGQAASPRRMPAATTPTAAVPSIRSTRQGTR
jgi:hypothetical protein